MQVRGDKIEPKSKNHASFFYWIDEETGGEAFAVAWAGMGFWENRMALRLSSALIRVTS